MKITEHRKANSIFDLQSVIKTQKNQRNTFNQFELRKALTEVSTEFKKKAVIPYTYKKNRLLVAQHTKNRLKVI